MKLYSVVKAAAVFTAMCGLAAVFVVSDARAQQANDAPGQINKTNPNNGNNGGLPPGLEGKTKDRGKCNGRGCGETLVPETPVTVTDVEDGDVLIIDCLLPQYKNDPLCYVPAKKPAKRKVVSVKLNQEELAVTPPAAAPVAAPVAPAPVVSAKPSAVPALPEANDVGSKNFQ